MLHPSPVLIKQFKQLEKSEDELSAILITSFTTTKTKNTNAPVIKRETNLF